LSGQLPLLAAIKSLMDEVMQPPSFDTGADGDEPFALEAGVLAAVRKIALFAAGVASQRFMAALQDQQEVMADLADIIAQVYALESALLRARKLAAAMSNSTGILRASVSKNMTGLLAEESIGLAEQAARRVLAACSDGDLLRTHLAILRRLARYTPLDSVALSRAVVQRCVERGGYPLEMR
jgi:butyryl-CoA dehydrogenase